MSSIGVLRDLAGFFLPIGYVGVSIAVLCAIVAAVALARGAAGLAGGAVGCWIAGAMLSLTGGFSGQWLLIIVAGASLVAALVLGALARAVITRMPVRTVSAEIDVAAEVSHAASATIASATSGAAEPAAVTRPRPVVLKAASQQ